MDSFIHSSILCHWFERFCCLENSVISMVFCLIRYLIMSNKVGMLVIEFILDMLIVQLKGLESGSALPSTSMAAHAVDEIETVELAEPASREVDKVSAYELPGLPFPPPPPPPHPHNAYSQVCTF